MHERGTFGMALWSILSPLCTSDLVTFFIRDHGVSGRAEAVVIRRIPLIVFGFAPGVVSRLADILHHNSTTDNQQRLVRVLICEHYA